MNPSELLEAEVEAPAIVEVEAGKSKVAVELACVIRNVSEQNYLVGSDDPENNHPWQLFDADHREVQRAPARRKPKGAKGEVAPQVSRLVVAGHSITTPLTVELDAGKLKEGEAYTLRTSFFGQVAETSFTVLRSPKLAKLTPARPRAKSAAKDAGDGGPAKKAPAKKAAAKKGGSSKKGAAKKQSGKKKARAKS